MKHVIVVSLSALGLCLAGLALGGCSEEEGEPTGSTCPEGSTLTYESFGLPFLQANCLSCHATKESPHLTSQAAVQANIDKIDRMAAAGPDATNNLMPEGASVPTEERKKLGEWLACGAP